MNIRLHSTKLALNLRGTRAVPEDQHEIAFLHGSPHSPLTPVSTTPWLARGALNFLAANSGIHRSSCAIYSAALQAGWYLRNSGETARYSVVAFFATTPTAEKSSVVQKKDGRKIRRRVWFYNMAMTLLIAESRPEEKNVLTFVAINLINRRNM
jgi:hypothetical protein